MGWGPVDWVGRLLPEAKFKIKCTSFFEFFGFERPLLRYLLKTVLHCKGSGIWVDAITQVTVNIWKVRGCISIGKYRGSIKPFGVEITEMHTIISVYHMSSVSDILCFFPVLYTGTVLSNNMSTSM